VHVANDEHARASDQDDTVSIDENQHIAVFLSHTLVAAPREHDGLCRYDAGSPDYPDCETANHKFHIAVRGVEGLIEERSAVSIAVKSCSGSFGSQSSRTTLRTSSTAS
jgi:hypothetical protein